MLKCSKRQGQNEGPRAVTSIEFVGRGGDFMEPPEAYKFCSAQASPQ